MTDINIKLNNDASLAVFIICVCIVCSLVITQCEYKPALSCASVCEPNAVKLKDTDKGICECDL